MNTIFKVIWNKSLGSAIVVAENTKNIGRTTTKTVKNLKNKSMEKQGKKAIKNTYHFIIASSALFAFNIQVANAEFAVPLNSFYSTNVLSGFANLIQGSGNVVIGHGNQVIGYNSISVGNDNRVAGLNSSVFGVNSSVTAQNSTAIGYDSLADEDNTISVGKVGAEKRITHVANGVKNTDAVNYGQLQTKADQSSVDLLNTDLSETRQEVSGFGTQISNHTNLISNLDRRVMTNEDDIVALDGRVGTAESDITGLKQGQSTLNQLAVQYDGVTQDTISLKGSNGTKLTNLQDARIDANSKDAVTGRQLYATDEKINTRIDTEVQGLNTNIGKNTNSIQALDGRVSINEGDIELLKQGQGSLGQLAVQYDSATQDTISLKGINGTKLTNLQDASVDAHSKDAVTGRQLYTTNQNVGLLSTQMISASNQIVAMLGGGASFTNGVFKAPTFSIQGVNYSNIGLTFNAVNNELTALKGSVNDLKTYVDSQDNKIASNAKDYTEDQSAGTLQNAKAYIDQQDAKNLTEAKGYTDQQSEQSLIDSKSYTDQQTAVVLDSAKDYADQQISSNGQHISIGGTGGGSTGTNATGQNSIAIGVNTVVTGHNSTAIGAGHQVSGNASGTFGDPNIVTGNGSYVIGNDNTIGGDNTFVLGNNISTTAQNAVVLGNDSSSDRDNTVSVGSDSNQRQIVHVAAGTADTDAVNVAQMKQSSSDTVTSANSYTDTKFSYLESSLKDYSLQTERRFQEVDKRFDRQGAMSAAMMNMALSTNGLRGQNRVGVGAGLQGQESAIAVGYQRVVNENTSFSISGATTKDESSGGVGVGFSW